MHILVRLYFETHDVFLALVNKRFHFLSRHGQRVTHLQARTCVILKIRYLSTLGLELFGRIKRDIRMTAVEQLFDVLMVYLTALALTVGTMLAHSFNLTVTHAQTFVDTYTKPLQ